ncbi:MAG: Gfo/Idh/MocA family oxidoreductase [candidate division KSB1 bacterium]|nr:Gfo/Idh/MocA family oxidoreductase [candidate division KSB1 bacterium]
MDRVRWGLIGCGDIARKRVAPALRDLPSCELVAVARARAELAERFAREFGAKRWYAHWQDLVADPEIEAVYIATPVYLHAEQTIAAALQGKHVLCEKPLALNVEQAERMLSVCRSRGVTLGVAYYRRFYPVVRRVKELLEQGAIGKPILIQINAFERFNPSPGEERYWLVQKELAGGGPMFDFGCHRIEVMLYLCGPMVEVQGLHSHALYRREVEDTTVATFRFADGTCGVLSVTHAAQEAQDTLSIFGSEGSVHVPVLNQGTLYLRSAGSVTTESHPPHPNVHLPLIEDFAQAVREERPPTVPGEVGLEVARIEELIYQPLSRPAG